MSSPEASRSESFFTFTLKESSVRAGRLIWALMSLTCRCCGLNCPGVGATSFRSNVTLDRRMISELIRRSSGVWLSVSFGAKESITNWKLGFVSAFCCQRRAWAPKSCADEMEIRPLVSGRISTLADRRVMFSISRLCWSRIVTSSMMIRSRKPKSTRPMLTSVPRASLKTADTLLPTDCWTIGSRRTAAVNKFRAITVQMTMLIIRFSIFTWQKYNILSGFLQNF